MCMPILLNDLLVFSGKKILSTTMAKMERKQPAPPTRIGSFSGRLSSELTAEKQLVPFFMRPTASGPISFSMTCSPWAIHSPRIQAGRVLVPNASVDDLPPMDGYWTGYPDQEVFSCQ